MNRLRGILPATVLALALLTLRAPVLAQVLQDNMAARALSALWQGQREAILKAQCGPNLSLPALESRFAGRRGTDSQVQLGRVYWLQGRCEEAVSQWREAAAAGSPSAAHELFRAGQYAGLPLDRRTQLAEMAYKNARNLAVDGSNEAALIWCTRAITLVPSRQRALEVAYWLERAGDKADAKVLWETFTGNTPLDSAEHWFAKGMALEQDDRWAAAAGAYTQGAELTEAPLDFWMKAGEAWERAAERELALTAYRKATETSPRSMQAFLSLGNVYRGLGQYEEAIRWTEAALEIDPNSYLPFYYLGLVFASAGNPEQAKRSFEKALELSPGDPWVSVQLARILARDMSQSQTAESLILAAMGKVAPPPPYWWVELGTVRVTQGHCQEAMDAFEKAQAAGMGQNALATPMAEYNTRCGAH